MDPLGQTNLDQMDLKRSNVITLQRFPAFPLFCSRFSREIHFLVVLGIRIPSSLDPKSIASAAGGLTGFLPALARLLGHFAENLYRSLFRNLFANLSLTFGNILSLNEKRLSAREIENAQRLCKSYIDRLVLWIVTVVA